MQCSVRALSQPIPPPTAPPLQRAVTALSGVRDRILHPVGWGGFHAGVAEDEHGFHSATERYRAAARTAADYIHCMTSLKAVWLGPVRGVAGGGHRATWGHRRGRHEHQHLGRRRHASTGGAVARAGPRGGLRPARGHVHGRRDGQWRAPHVTRALRGCMRGWRQGRRRAVGCWCGEGQRRWVCVLVCPRRSPDPITQRRRRDAALLSMATVCTPPALLHWQGLVRNPNPASCGWGRFRRRRGVETHHRRGAGTGRTRCDGCRFASWRSSVACAAGGGGGGWWWCGGEARAGEDDEGGGGRRRLPGDAERRAAAGGHGCRGGARACAGGSGTCQVRFVLWAKTRS